MRTACALQAGVRGYDLSNYDRVRVHKIKASLNPKLHLIGLLPTLVEPTHQRANFVQVVQMYSSLLIKLGTVHGALRLCAHAASLEQRPVAWHPARS